MEDAANASFNKPFPLGEGTIIVNRKAAAPFAIKIALQNQHDGYVKLRITRDEATFLGTLPGNENTQLALETNIGYEPTKTVAYWFSFDRDARVLKYGKGYIMEETTLMEYRFPKPDPEGEDEWEFLFHPSVHKDIIVVEDLAGNSRAESGLVDAEKSVDFYPYPLINNWPYLIQESSVASFFDLASSDVILSASLPAECQELYHNIASPNVALDWPAKVTKHKLSDAIRYSIVTDGKILNKIIKAREEKGGKQFLIITVGDDHGNSLGTPYKLELWPAGSKSPIHNHGNSYAVVKVLYGEINIDIFNKTWPDSEDDPGEPLKSFTASKGNFTWIAPNWYQTHQLTNKSDDYCATVQCYKYGVNDKLMWPYFDSLAGVDVHESKPSSDFEFVEFRRLMLEEFTNDHPEPLVK